MWYITSMNDALHIENARASQLAHELAERTGETVADAVIHALEERLELLRRTSRGPEDAKVTELLGIAERAVGLQAEEKTSRQLVDELYDEQGLPR